MDINEIYKDENKDDDNSDGSGAEIQMLDIINKFSKKETAAESNLLKELETLNIKGYDEPMIDYGDKTVSYANSDGSGDEQNGEAFKHFDDGASILNLPDFQMIINQNKEKGEIQQEKMNDEDRR